MRISRRITRDDAGKAIGVSGKTIERIENGRRNISDERLKQLIRQFFKIQQNKNTDQCA